MKHAVAVGLALDVRVSQRADQRLLRQSQACWPHFSQSNSMSILVPYVVVLVALVAFAAFVTSGMASTAPRRLAVSIAGTARAGWRSASS